MNRKLLIILGVAFLAAITTTAFFYNLLSDKIAASDKPPAPRAPIVIAARDLPRGTQLAPEDLSVESWDEARVPEGAFSEIEPLKGKFVISSVPAGLPVLESSLPGPGASGIAAAIPSGMRAVSLHVIEFMGVNLLLERGDRVDVLAANAVRAPGRPNTTLRTILQNVAVLSTGRDPGPDGRRPGQAVVTVLVEAEDVEKLSLADHAGAIRLALRNPLDDESRVTKALRIDEVFKPRASRRPRSAKSVRPKTRSRVERATAAPPPAAVATEKPAPPEQARVLIALRFAGLGDAALARFTARLDKRYTAYPLIVSSFKSGWDVEGVIEELQRGEGIEIFAAPNFLTLDRGEVRFEQSSHAPARTAGAERGEEAGIDAVGVKIALIPTVLAGGAIRMKIRSEATIPDPTHTVRIAGAEWPRVSVRRSECVIELAEGQSFWIRGLIDRPGAWDFLRRLFPRRPLERDGNDELVILVTPRLAPPGAEKDPRISTLLSQEGFGVK